MKDQAFSFRAEGRSLRWYREPWPWLLIAGPLAVVIASLASAWLAVRSDDGVIADDYYKQGLQINRRLPFAAPDPARRLGATITVTARGEVLAHIEGLADPPQELRLELSQPGKAHDVVTLRPGPSGEYVGALAHQAPGRWIVTLESTAWRLPTTVTSRLSGVRLGTAERSASSAADRSD